MTLHKVTSGLTGALLLSCCAGCFFAGGKEESFAEYSLPPPLEQRLAPLPVKFGVVRNISGADRLFLVRKTDNRMVADSSRRWLLAPEVMLERALRERFSEASDAGMVLNATICEFEIDEKSSKLYYAVLFFCSGQSANQPSFRIAIRENIVNGDVVTAMGKAVNALLNGMEQRIK